MTLKNKTNLDFNDLEFTVDFHCLLKILCIWWSWIWNLNNKDCLFMFVSVTSKRVKQNWKFEAAHRQESYFSMLEQWVRAKICGMHFTRRATRGAIWGISPPRKFQNIA